MMWQKKGWCKKDQNMAVLNQKPALFLHLFHWKNAHNLATDNVAVTEWNTFSLEWNQIFTVTPTYWIHGMQK